MGSTAPSDAEAVASYAGLVAAPATRRPTPVFVLGLQHSGTTWLASILAQHSRVAAVVSAEQRGIHESILFSHFAPAYGDLNDDANFERFATDFTSSGFYLLSGADPSWLWDLRPRSYAEALRALMEEVARRRGGADLWIEKSPDHTLLAEELAEAFPDARFVGITRRPQTAIASRMWGGGRRPPPYPARLRVLLALSAWRTGERWLKRFSRDRDRCFLTTYERLVADPEAETRQICEFLGIAYEPAMLEPTFRANTSFESTDQRHRALSVPDKAVLATAGAAMWLVPSALWRKVVMWRRARVAARGGIVFPDWPWHRRDSDRLIFEILDSLTEDAELREGARSGEFSSFAPLCNDKFAAKALDPRNQSREFFERAFADPEVRRDLTDAVGREVYRRILREDADYVTPTPSAGVDRP